MKEYHVSAINIEITLSRFLDYFPGYMYVLKENVEKARGEEAANREAREKENDPGAVSNGLQGDVIQPLVIRANQGDCLKLTLHNEITDEPTNLVINGSSMVVASTGKPATPSNPEGTVASGRQQSFEWYIKPDTQEGARFFRSHASREQFNQGLIGMLVVEPRGSRYLSPFDGKPMASGWEAMIEDPKGADFREFAIFYHEAGDEAFRLLNKKGEMLPQRDPHTDSYRPGARLLNYRSEPHGTRIELQAHMGFYGDESMAYGSYTFGDPATTIPRSYLGDPAKFRMAGGSEIVHSHHLHGGSIRWARQPGNSNLDFAAVEERAGEVPCDQRPLRPFGRAVHRADRSLRSGDRGWFGRPASLGRRVRVPLPHPATLCDGHVGILARVQHAASAGFPDRCDEAAGRTAGSRRQDQDGHSVGQACRHHGGLVRRQEVRDHQGQDRLESQSGQGLHQGLGGDDAHAARQAGQEEHRERADVGL